MRPKREAADYLRDILHYAGRAQEFVSGVDFATFCATEEKVLAVVRALEVVGEAARQVPAAVRRQYPAVPWNEAIGMRDKLIHDYFGIDLEVVWKTVHNDLPPLQEAVVDVLAALEPENTEC